MRKDDPPPICTRISDSLEFFARKIGSKVPEKGSEETIRELLKSTLMVPRCQQEIFSYFVKKNKIDCIDSTTSKFARDSDEDSKDKPSGKLSKEFFNDEEKSVGGSTVETEQVCALMDEIELSFDGKWLRKNLEVPLKMAMKEIIARKPSDPIHYLGFLLLNYKSCQENEQWQLEKKQELDYLRSLIKKSESTPEECVSVDRGEEEEEEEQIRDWNFKYYDSSHIDV